MSEQIQIDRNSTKSAGLRGHLKRGRWSLWCLGVGLLLGAWAAGGTGRYGEEDGIVGGLRGSGRTMVKAFRYAAASLKDCVTFDRSAVRKLGLRQQIETRLWQDKRLVADDILVEVEDGGTAVLKGIVVDDDDKEKAVTLVRDTRGVEKVVDELAVRPSSRTIKAAPADPVPTGVASGTHLVR